MTEEDKAKHMERLWRKLQAKAVGASRIIRHFSELSNSIGMFGATRRIAVEIDEEIEPLPFILMPDSRLRMFWNIVTLLLLLYTATFVPYRTSFIDISPPGLDAWEWAVNALFMVDIVVNFISAYENSDKNIEVRLKMIAKTYAQTWFLLDACACFPFQLFEGESEA